MSPIRSPLKSALRPRRRAVLSDSEVAAAWQCASLLLDYPGSCDLGPVRDVVPRLPGPLRQPLAECLDRLDAVDEQVLESDYVATFDSRRRCNLFLTYFAHGDTRKRGLALLRFKHAYLAAGVAPDEEELPDHLCMVLEFGATADRTAARELLLDHRAGLELLRMSLADADAPWAGAVAAVCATLPPLAGDEVEAVRRLAEEGPPAEEVGLTPYGTPGFDAALTPTMPSMSPPSGPVDLPMPSMPGPDARRGA
jgi:nitrate reductase delta subunit